MKTGNRNYGPASLKLSYSQVAPAHLRGGLLELSHLECEESQRGQGYATELMELVCAEASKAKVLLMLMVDDDQKRLMDFYSRFGFDVLQKEPLIMLRQPMRLNVSMIGEAVHV